MERIPSDYIGLILTEVRSGQGPRRSPPQALLDIPWMENLLGSSLDSPFPSTEPKPTSPTHSNAMPQLLPIPLGRFHYLQLSKHVNIHNKSKVWGLSLSSKVRTSFVYIFSSTLNFLGAQKFLRFSFISNLSFQRFLLCI